MNDNNEGHILTPEKEDVAKKMILRSLVNKKSTYNIEVINNSSLPAKLKSKKEIQFEIKPPVLQTLSRLAEITIDMPKELFDSENKLDFLEYIPQMVDMMIVLFHGTSKKPVPEWYKDFLLDNLTPDETTLLMHECMMKCKTDFFLNFFQTAEQMNPMMMKDRTPKEISD